MILKENNSHQTVMEHCVITNSFYIQYTIQNTFTVKYSQPFKPLSFAASEHGTETARTVIKASSVKCTKFEMEKVILFDLLPSPLGCCSLYHVIYIFT